jgi:hypothetical protein
MYRHKLKKCMNSFINKVRRLGKKAFQLAGEIADGALSWMCPVPYLLRNGIPALHTAAVGRSALPPLVAHVMVALSQDRHSVLATGHQLLDTLVNLPFYTKMFADAGRSDVGTRCSCTQFGNLMK